MKKVINVNTNEIITVEELKELHLREYKEIWDNNLNIQVEDFKEEGKSFEDYFEYMEENLVDSDYKLLEDSDYIYNKYIDWRECGDKMHEIKAFPFDWDCNKKYVREEFSEFIGLDFIIDYEVMSPLEKRYNIINYGTSII